ncbi:FkbM family methyltransferase [Pseudotabrizicola sp. L79]|uniref:FkbM family methyltransferase n=1 Tax=Pseudotabrizicola sp. L79 TaxID=3118402 RepID=UPI002F958692
MRSSPDISAAPFGAFAPDGWAYLVMATFSFDRPHRTWPLHRKLAKRWLRASEKAYDVCFRGLRLRLLPSSNAGDEGIVLNGIHGEEDEFDRVIERVAEYDNFIDIGANIGLYSMLAGRILPPDRPIIAFEPAPDTFERLKTHLAFNGMSDRVTVINAAVAEAPGELALFRPPHNQGGTSATKRFDHWQEIKVSKVTLADALNDLGIDHIGMLKIDIEGFEDSALLPYFDVMPPKAWPRYILTEVCHRRFWKRDLVAELRAFGYREVYSNQRNIHFALDEGRA